MVDPFSIAVSVAGLLSLAIQVSQILYTQVKDVKHACKEGEEICGELSSLENFLKSLEAFLKDQEESDRTYDTTSVLVSALKGCEKKLLDVRVKLKSLESKSSLKVLIERGKWLYKKDEHLELIRTFHRYTSLFQLSLSIDGILKSAVNLLADADDMRKMAMKCDDILEVLAPLSDMPSKIEEISFTISKLDIRLQDEASQEIASWLSPLNEEMKLDDTYGQRQVGTGTWFLNDETFMRWTNGKLQRLWCPGSPGAGKTVLAASTIDYLRRHKLPVQNMVVFHFFNYKERGAQSATNIISSFIQQIARQRTELPDHIVALYKRHSRSNTRPSLTEWSEVLQKELKNCSEAFLILDAFDESSEENGTRNKILAELRKLPTNTHVMITSRHVESLKTDFEPSAEIEIQASDSDVRKFVLGFIDSSNRLKKALGNDTGLKHDVVDSIAKQSKGMFLLAKLHMESLARKQSRRAIRESLHNLPNGLSATYEEAVFRIVSQEQDDADLAMNVLAWVSCALRPLKVEELQYAIGTQAYGNALGDDDLIDQEILASVCGGLVIIDPESTVIRLIHYTAQEYFDRMRPNHFPGAQANIARSCTTYLTSGIQCPSALSHSDEIFKQFPFLNYASEFWGYHLRGSLEKELMPSIKLVLASNSLALSELLFTNISYFYRAIFRQPYGRFSGLRPEDQYGLDSAARFGLEFLLEELIADFVSERPQDIDSLAGFALEVALYSNPAQISTAERLMKLWYPSKSQMSDWVSNLARIGINSVDGIKFLIQKGAGVNTLDIYGESPISCALIQYLEEPALFSLLLENGAKFGEADRSRALQLYRHANTESSIAGAHEMLTRLWLMEQDKVLELGVYCKYLAAALSKDDLAFAMRALNHLQQNCIWTPTQKVEQIKLAIDSTELAAAAHNGDDVIKWFIDMPLGIEPAAIGYTGPVSRDLLIPFLILAAANGNISGVSRLVDAGVPVNGTMDHGSNALGQASAQEHISVMEFLLERGADIEAQGDVGQRPLHLAAWYKASNAVKFLLEHGCNVNSATSTGMTALDIAVQNAHVELVSLLLEQGAGTNIDRLAINPDSQPMFPPLHMAAAGRNVAILNMLLKFGASIDVQDWQGETAVNVAAMNQRDIMMEWLVSAGARLDVPNNHHYGPLHVAASSDSNACVKFLLSQGIDVDIQFEDGPTPLYIAAGLGNVEIMNTLLVAGACLELSSIDKVTPVFGSVYGGHRLAVELLLQQGARVDTGDKHGKLPIHVAASIGHREICKLLLNHGSPVDARTTNGVTALLIAASTSQLEVMEELLNSGAQVDLPLPDGGTPLIAAAYDGHLEAVLLLLQAGAKPETKTENGLTALHCAAGGGHHHVVEVFVQLGYMTDMQTAQGHTALYKAAENNHISTMELLLKSGAKLDIEDSEGRTALYRAEEKGHKEAVTLLLRYYSSRPDDYREALNLILCYRASIAT